MSARKLPKWASATLLFGPAVPLIGMGLVHVDESEESWTGLVPFVLLAAFAVAVMGAVYGARDDTSVEAARSEPPMTRRQFQRYVFGLAILPGTILACAVVAVVNHWWLTTGVFTAMLVPPTLLRAFAIQAARANRQP